MTTEQCYPLNREAPSRNIVARSRIPVSKAPTLLIGVDPQRRAVTITNTAPTDGTGKSLFVSPNKQPAPSADGAYELEPGEGQTFRTAGALWAFCLGTDTATAKFAAEVGAV